MARPGPQTLGKETPGYEMKKIRNTMQKCGAPYFYFVGNGFIRSEAEGMNAFPT